MFANSDSETTGAQIENMAAKQVAVVTGAYQGLGLAICENLLSNGYEVVLTRRSKEKAEEVAKEIGAVGHALDVANENDMQTLATWLTDTFGKVDLLVNNAGVNPKDYKNKDDVAKAFYLDKLDAEAMFDVYRVNSLAPLLMVKHLKPLLLHGTRPKVINISSWLGSVSGTSFGAHYGYTSSKNLLNMLTKSMTLEIKKDGIVACSVNPGWVKTSMGGEMAKFTPQQAAENIYKNVVAKIGLDDTGRFINAEDGKDHPW